MSQNKILQYLDTDRDHVCMLVTFGNLAVAPVPWLRWETKVLSRSPGGHALPSWPLSDRYAQSGLLFAAVCYNEVSAVENSLWNTFHTVSASMVTSWYRNTFHITVPLYGEPPVSRRFPSQNAVMCRYDGFFDFRWSTRLNKQSTCR